MVWWVSAAISSNNKLHVAGGLLIANHWQYFSIPSHSSILLKTGLLHTWPPGYFWKINYLLQIFKHLDRSSVFYSFSIVHRRWQVPNIKLIARTPPEVCNFDKLSGNLTGLGYIYLLGIIDVLVFPVCETLHCGVQLHSSC